MNIPEGARRIQKVGRILLSFAAAAIIFMLIVVVIANFTTTLHLFPFALVPMFIAFCIWPGTLGTAFLIVGWIVEGFATPSSTASGD